MGNAFSFAGEDTLIIWPQAHMGAAGSALESFFSMFGEELLLIPVLGFFCWCYDKKLGKLLGRNICVESVCSPMIKNIALRYAVIFFADIALYPLLFDRIGRKSGQEA